MTQDMMTSIF